MQEKEFKIVDVVTGEEYLLSEKRIKELTSKFIEECGEQANLDNDFSKNVVVVKLLIDIKKAWWPATQKAFLAETEDFDKSLDKWYLLQKQLLEEKNKQQPEVEEIVITPSQSNR